MSKGFKTLEEAKENLEKRKKEAYQRIHERGDKVLGDSSVIIQEPIWEHETSQGPLVMTSMRMTDKIEYVPMLNLLTRDLVNDLKNMKPFNPELEIEELERIRLRESRKDKIKRIFR